MGTGNAAIRVFHRELDRLKREPDPVSDLLSDPTEEEIQILQAIRRTPFAMRYSFGKNTSWDYIVEVMKGAAQSVHRLPERLWFQIAMGETNPDLLAGIPYAPDEMPLFTAGQRHGVKTGNHIAGIARRPEAIEELWYRAIMTARMFQGNEGQPLLDMDMVQNAKLLVICHPEDQPYLLPGEFKGYAKHLKLWVTQRLVPGRGFAVFNFGRPPVTLYNAEPPKMEEVDTRALVLSTSYVPVVRLPINSFSFDLKG